MLASHFGWRSVFLVLFLFTGFMFFVVAFFTPETLPSENKKPFTLQQLLVDSFSLFRIREFYYSHASEWLCLCHSNVILHNEPSFDSSIYGIQPYNLLMGVCHSRFFSRYCTSSKCFFVTRYTLLGICRLGVSLLLLSTVVFSWYLYYSVQACGYLSC